MVWHPQKRFLTPLCIIISVNLLSNELIKLIPAGLTGDQQRTDTILQLSGILHQHRTSWAVTYTAQWMDCFWQCGNLWAIDHSGRVAVLTDLYQFLKNKYRESNKFEWWYQSKNFRIPVPRMFHIHNFPMTLPLTQLVGVNSHRVHVLK